VKNPDRVIDKEELFQKVWEDKFTGDGTLNVHIRHLREKLEENPNEPQFIQTVWGTGYIFKKD
jgi:two-component system response regulator RegX3